MLTTLKQTLNNTQAAYKEAIAQVEQEKNSVLEYKNIAKERKKRIKELEKEVKKLREQLKKETFLISGHFLYISMQIAPYLSLSLAHGKQ